MSHLFSTANLRAQEPIVSKYLDQLVRILQSKVREPLDLSAMLEFMLFDVTGDMTFGEHFNCLNDNTLHVRSLLPL
jgi:Cytochrome P450